MGEWTRADVEARLESAAYVMHFMPKDKPGWSTKAWPTYQHDFSDKVGQPPEGRRPRPSPRSISEAEAAMLWLRWLDVEDAKLVWARADGTPWKPICWKFGVSRATARRRWEYALSVIVWRLNGRRVPRKRSREFVISEARRS